LHDGENRPRVDLLDLNLQPIGKESG
jgi:hypothetical protein